VKFANGVLSYVDLMHKPPSCIALICRGSLVRPAGRAIVGVQEMPLARVIGYGRSRAQRAVGLREYLSKCSRAQAMHMLECNFRSLPHGVCAHVRWWIQSGRG
jgi:hypothetical protein